MSDPYLVLGVKPTASDEEVKRAYRELVKKYHPDHYQNNPLSDLAEEKMKEVNEAYDAIIKMRSNGGYHYSGGGYQGQSHGGASRQGSSTSDPAFGQVRTLLDMGNLNEAQRLLENSGVRSAEWYYLMGSVAYRRGWLAEARDNFMIACNMEPSNMEYRQAADYLNNQAGRGFQTYRGGGGMSTGDLCAMLACWSCLCDGCG
jgi:curved DNA-binding protein CbpA